MIAIAISICTRAAHFPRLLSKKFKISGLLSTHPSIQIGVCNLHCTSFLNVSELPIPDFKLNHTGLNSYLKKVVSDYMSNNQQSDNQRTINRDLITKENDLKNLTHLIQDVWNHNEEVAQLEQLITELCADKSSGSAELMKLATEDLNSLQTREENLKDMLLPLLLPKRSTDHMDILLELGAGAGGQEAMLFTAEMYAMYSNYAQWRGWHCQELDYSESDLGGIRHAVLSISGEKVGESMRFESGVHRVQRVPKTERTGRIHTSTMTVAVLPQPTEVEVHINPKDLIVDTKRAAGAGGQSVNKTESAIRITHVPTGIVVECQIERSQIKNRELAMQNLRARIFDRKQKEQSSKHITEKKMQVGSGDRAEKVRTYNYNQDRITDHRLGTTYHNISEFLKGREHLDAIIAHSQQTEHLRRLEALLENKAS